MEAQDAIAWWLANIGTERIPVNPFWQDFAKKGGILKRDNSDESRILCGYDWKKLEKLHAANAIWKDVFGNEIPDVSVAREHEDIKRIVSENSIEFSLCP
jgi:hypothetical protein